MKLVWEILFWWPLLGAYLLCKGSWWFCTTVWHGILGQGKADEPHGNAAWATVPELKAGHNLEPGGFLVGKLNGKEIYTHPEKSLIMYGSPGVGKSVMMEANLRRADGWDCIVYDPAASLYDRTREALEARGYTVLLLDLNKPEAGIDYDPLTFFNASTPLFVNRDYEAFGQLVCPADTRSQVGEHFSTISQRLMTGAIRHLQTTEPARVSLDYAAGKLCRNAQQCRLMFDEMAKRSDPIVQMAVNAFSQAGDREKGSFATTMFTKMEIWADPSLAMVMGKKSGFTFEQMFAYDKPVALFIQGGMGVERICGSYARLVIGNAINTVLRGWNRGQGKLPKGLKVFVDEAKQIGRCDALLTVQRELRKAGVRLFMSYVDKADMEQAFDKDANLLANTCDLIIPSGVRDTKLLNQVVELVGKQTSQTRSVSNNSSGESENVSQFGRNLISVDELRRLPNDELVVMLGNLSTRVKKPWTIDKKGLKF
jgi:type IV secretory pathway TraG/TraD family ATPase VirD4